MWLEHDDEMVNLDNVFLIKKEDIEELGSTSGVCFLKTVNRVDIQNDNAFFFFDNKSERDAYWQKHIIPLLNK